MTEKLPAANGGPGRLLKALREKRTFQGKPLSMKDVSDLSGVSRDVISRLEHGREGKLKREKLDLILAVLDRSARLTFLERAQVLRAFGYEPGNGLPTAADVRNAVAAWASWKEKPYPVYLTDYAFRIHDWNDLVPRFLGMEGNASVLRSLTALDLAFGEALRGDGLDVQIANGDTFLRTWIEDMKTELSRYEDEPWHRDFVSLHGRKYPAFKQLWDSVAHERRLDWEPQLLPPIHLTVNGSEPLKFRVSGPELASDHRFRIIEYNPCDAETGRRCFELLAGG